MSSLSSGSNMGKESGAVSQDPASQESPAGAYFHPTLEAHPALSQPPPLSQGLFYSFTLEVGPFSVASLLPSLVTH